MSDITNPESKPTAEIRLLRSTALAASGQFAGYAVALALMPILTRVYTPADFGALSLYMGVFSIVATLSTLRYETAIILPRTNRSAINLVILPVCLATLVGAVLVAVVNCSPRLAMSLPASLPLVFGVHLGVQGAFESLTAWTVRHRSYGWTSLARFVSNALSSVAQVAFGMMLPCSVSLIAGSVVGPGFAVLALFLLDERLRASLPNISPKIMWLAAGRYRSFPLLEVPSVILNSLSGNAPVVLLGIAYGSTVAGWYGVGARALAMPALLFGIATGRVYLAEASLLARQTGSRLSPLFLLTIRRSLFLLALPFAVAVFAAPQLFAMGFGEQWREAGVYCLILAPWTLAHLMATVISGTNVVLEQQHVTLRTSALLAASTAVSGTIPAWLGASARMTLGCMSLGGFLCCLLTIWLAWRNVQRFDLRGVNLREQALILPPPLAA